MVVVQYVGFGSGSCRPRCNERSLFSGNCTLCGLAPQQAAERHSHDRYADGEDVTRILEAVASANKETQQDHDNASHEKQAGEHINNHLFRGTKIIEGVCAESAKRTPTGSYGIIEGCHDVFFVALHHSKVVGDKGFVRNT